MSRRAGSSIRVGLAISISVIADKTTLPQSWTFRQRFCTAQRQNRRGDMARPTDDPKTGRIDLRLPPRVVAEIDEWRRVQDDIPARSEAMRRLIELGLEADRQMDLLKEDIAILRAVAREWAQKAGAPPEILHHIDSDDPGRAESSGLLRKYRPPRGAELGLLRNVTSDLMGKSPSQGSPDPNRPVQHTPKRPKKT